MDPCEERARIEALAVHEFPVTARHIYLNHAGVSPWPERSRQMVRAYIDDITAQGAVNAQQWQTTEQRLRERLRELLNAPSRDDIALVPNTSAGLSLVAAGIDWRAGDNVVITDSEFPSNRMVWEALAERGVETREARCTPSGSVDCEGNLLQLVDHRTRLVSVSSVQFGTGLSLDLVRLGRELASSQAAFCIDAIQSLGAFPFDVGAVQADFVAADGHKWMLGPEGLGVFYCTPEWRERLRLQQFGWHMADPLGDFDTRDWHPTTSARRFEPGTPNTVGIYGLEASLSLLQEVGIHQIAARISARLDTLIEGLAYLPEAKCISPCEPARRAGILTLRFGESTQAVYQVLRERNVQVQHRGGGIRFAPHFYNSFDELTKVVELVGECLEGNGR